jgi:pimeloyl-ACP methyl ester carboxylesterase
MSMKAFVYSLLFQPPRCRAYRIPTKITYLPTSRDHHIATTYIRRPGAAKTIIYSHGNGEDLNATYYYMVKLSAFLDVNVIAYDYAGYGMSTGKTTKTRCQAISSRVRGSRVHAIYTSTHKDTILTNRLFISYDRLTIPKELLC